LLADYKVLQEL